MQHLGLVALPLLALAPLATCGSCKWSSSSSSWSINGIRSDMEVHEVVLDPFFIARHELVRTVTRWALAPLVYSAAYPRSALVAWLVGGWQNGQLLANPAVAYADVTARLRALGR